MSGMAKKTEVIVTVTDDLDGSKAERTVLFGWDGKSYEIDLSKRNAAALEKLLAPYIEAGRRVRANGSSRRSSGSSAAKSDTADVRAWAAENGFTVSARGRIPANVIDAYRAAH
jgi:hypothetical protein